MRLTAAQAFDQNESPDTEAFYAALRALGPRGEIAAALLIAGKWSHRAKAHRVSRNWRYATYDVKNWAMREVCRLLGEHGEALGFVWGWGTDARAVGYEHVLYVEIPGIGPGQVCFHSPVRFTGPDYRGTWDGQNAGRLRVVAFATTVIGSRKVA